MTPEQINLVFGRSRLKMATGEHVEVFREAVGLGERRRYTKRFLDSGDADFGQWTEREWRILARLIGHGIRCVPDVVQFDGGAMGGMRLVQTYDAGVTVDQWATLLPVSRDGRVCRHIFEERAHWWALAHYCLAALDEIHALQLVHLDIKGDNICIPYGPTSFDPEAADVRFYPVFEKLALIDFAFSLVSRENLATPLPIGWQKDYDYQSPRLLRALEAGRNGDLEPTRELDWRCDLYSLAAMLKRYLPDRDHACSDGKASWTPESYENARSLIFRLRDCHDRDFSPWRPHQQLLEITAAQIVTSDSSASLEYGWTLAPHATNPAPATPITPITPITPLTRIAPSIRALEPLRIVDDAGPTAITVVERQVRAPAARPFGLKRKILVPALGALAALAVPAFVGDPARPLADRALETIRSMFTAPAESTVAQLNANDATRPSEPTAAPPPTPEVAKPAGEPAPVTARDDETRAQRDAAPYGSSSRRKSLPPQAAASRAKPAAAARQQAAPRTTQSARTKAKESAPSHPIPSLAALETLSKQPRASNASVAVAHRSKSRQTQTPEPQPQPAPAAVQLASNAVTTPPIEQPSTPAVAPTMEERHGEASAAPVEKTEPKRPAVTLTPDEQTPPAREERRAPALAASRAARSAPDPQSSDPIAALWQLLTGARQSPAPIEDRQARSSERAAVIPTQRAQTTSNEARASEDAGIKPLPSGVAAPGRTTEPRPQLASDAQDGYAMQGRRVLADIVPRIAARAEPDVIRVLWVADSAYQPAQEQSVIAGISLTWPSENLLLPPGINLAPVLARRLHDDARQAFASGRDASRATNLELQAFGADPRDPDIAGYLAFLHLKAKPAQAERARQLALYAIALSGALRPTRPDDWNTLAIASALSGREADATRAMFVAIALTRDAAWSCRAVLGAYASFGEQLRGPAEAALYRIHAQGRGSDSPYCAWPANWGNEARSLDRLSFDGQAR